MTPDKLTWFEQLHPVSDDVISDFEDKLGISLPEDYRAFLRKYQGGVPVQTDFVLNDPRKRVVSVGLFLGVLPDHADEYILSVIELLRDRLPERLIPIAMGPGGDYVMLDLRGQKPSIIYWHHERVGDPDECTFVASSFSDFISLLFEPDIEAESQLDDPS